MGAADGSKCECQAAQVVCCVMGGGAPFLDGAKQFGHGAVKAIWKPLPVQLGSSDAFCGEDLQVLFLQTRAAAQGGCLRSDQEGAVVVPHGGCGVEAECCLRGWVVDQDVGEHGGAGALAVCACDGCENLLGGCAAKVAGQHIEPVDGKIVEHQVVDCVEGGADDPRVVPVHREICADQFAEQPGGHCQPEVGDMGCPSSVLVDGELCTLSGGQFAESFAGVEVEHKRFLAENVFVGHQGGLDQRHTFGGVGGDIHHFDVVAAQQVVGICVDGGVGVEGGFALLGACEMGVAQRHDVVACCAVGGEVVCGDAAAADQPDAGASVWGAWAIGELCCGKRRLASAECAGVTMRLHLCLGVFWLG